MSKIYLVQRSRGQYEDYTDWVDSVWLTLDKAKVRALELVHYDPQKELDRLDIITVDPFGNNLTVADVMYDGSGTEGEWCDGAVHHGEFDRKTKEWRCPAEFKDRCVQLSKYPHYFVEKEFLTKYNLTVEDADKYIMWLTDSEREEWTPEIIEMEMSVPDAQGLVYSYDEKADDYIAPRVRG